MSRSAWSLTGIAGLVVWIISSSGNPLSAETPPRDTTLVRVKGRVLGPDGEPVKGARLYSALRPTPLLVNDPIVALAQTEPTDATGRFGIQLRKSASDQFAYVIAYAPGLGVDWINVSEEESPPEVTLRLVKDVPISGRVVNTEGRPVAGCSVSISGAWVPVDGKLDEFLKGWHGGQSAFVNNLFSPMKRLYAPLDAISGAATTDKDGRFTLHGAGGERIVQVTISGSGVARTTLFVITRPGFNAEPYNAVLRKDEAIRRFVVANRFLGLHPPTFTIVAEAGKTIEGVVKDADTGKPLAGCRVRANNGFQTRFSAIANAEGKYRLEGMAKGTNGYSLIAMPPTGSVHLPRRVQAADTVGLPKVRLDIDLMKGGIVTGRVVDKQTGKRVRCYFASYPLPDNKFIGSKPGFDSRDVLLQRVAEYDEDGRFRLVAIPGKSLLTARVMETEKMNGLRLNVYRQALPDPEHKDIFTAAGDSWRVAAVGNYLVILNDENAVKVIDVKENSETRVELSVERGATARIQVQDVDGKPLAGAWAAGLSDLRLNTTFKLPEATATVCALNPDKPRAMAFFHAGKKLSGTAMISGGEKEPVIVKLAPVGKVTGRLLDADGNPRKGVEVSILPRTDLGRDLFRFAELIGNPVRTDNDGRFRIEDVVPGLKFTLTLRQGRAFFVGEPPISVKQVKPGETLDLGNIRIKPIG